MNREEIREAATSEEQIQSRVNLAKFTSTVFQDVGTVLDLTGHFGGSDRRNGMSPFGHGDDAAVAVGMLLLIGSQLVSASVELMSDGRHYAGAALIRQLVEIEYLAWAFETKDTEAAQWLRSTQEERRNFFSPAKLRRAAGNRFRSLDYGYHCEFGGHPVPGSWILLIGDTAIAQLMLSDCLGHSGRIWDHIVSWARTNASGAPILEKSHAMSEGYMRWKRIDKLTELSPPPGFPISW